MRALLVPLLMLAAVPAAAAPPPRIAFSAIARPKVARTSLHPHVEVVAQRIGVWDKPKDWRWMSDAAQLAWSLAHYKQETPLCRIVLRRRVDERKVLKVILSEPRVIGRPAQERILALGEDPALPVHEFVVPLLLPDGKQPAPECGEDPRIALRAKLADLQSQGAACAAAAQAAEGRARPLNWGQNQVAAEAHRSCGDLDGMERILRTTVMQFEANAPKHPERPQALYELGTLLVSRGRLNEGEVPLRRAIDLSLSAGVEGSDLAVAVEELAELYEALDQPDLAKRRWVQAIALHEQAARAAGLATVAQLRGLAERRRASSPRGAELFARRADQLALAPQLAHRKSAK